MIKNKPAYLKLCRLIITSKAKEVYNEKFNNGINIIRGENSSGKSTIANMIFYILGGAEILRWCQENRYRSCV
jgi:predicted ATPase